MHDNTVSGSGIKFIPCQLQRILKQRGQHLTIIVAGQAGTGKSTFINSLFQSTILDNNELINRRYTVKSQAPYKYNFRFTEADVNIDFPIKLRVIDTPDLGNSINNSNSGAIISNFIDYSYFHYFNQVQQPNRTKRYDSRVHFCLYFISPTNQGVPKLDVKIMQELSSKCNLIPIVAKADTFGPMGLQEAKDKVRWCLNHFGIRVYEPSDLMLDESQEYLAKSPLGICSSSKWYINQDGVSVLGRQYPWGLVEVENPEHSDFTLLKNMILRTHLKDFIDTMEERFYEPFQFDIVNGSKTYEFNLIKSTLDDSNRRGMEKQFEESVEKEKSHLMNLEGDLLRKKSLLENEIEDLELRVKRLQVEVGSLESITSLNMATSTSQDSNKYKSLNNPVNTTKSSRPRLTAIFRSGSQN